MATPVPDIMLDSIFDITPELLHEKGITLLLMDLDNTLAPYGAELPSQALLSWTRNMEQNGVIPFLYSNNRGDRPRIFAKALSVDFIGHAGKPSPKNLNKVLSKYGKTKNDTAIVGDQIYTDILFGANSGILSIAVHPMVLTNLFRMIRYGTEFPFRLKYRKIQRKKKRNG